MKKPLLELAEMAGFAFWKDEEHKPENATIDWSCNYDKEFECYTRLVAEHVVDYLNQNDFASKEDVLVNLGFLVLPKYL
jgi:hypothetical protein